jgi:hypothetical protein
VFNYAQTPDPMQSRIDQVLRSAIAISTMRPHIHHMLDYQQQIVTAKSYSLADIIVKTAYFSLSAAVLLFVLLLLLTTIHP